MERIREIDPMLYGFFKDESLELGERIAMALVEFARTCDISFDRSYFPCFEFASKTTRFSFSDSLSYNWNSIPSLIEEHPELADELNVLGQKLKNLEEKKSILRDARYHVKADAQAIWGGGWGGHSNPDYGRLVNIGTEGVRAKIAECKKLGNPDSDWFYRACEMIMDAFDILGERFLELARSLAATETDPKIKKYYEDAARAFEVVPKKPAYDFVSAAHSFSLHFVADGNDSPGRFDQYMWRAWELTENKDEARDAIERLWENFHDRRSWNLCLAGSDENWNDESNELTYEILRIAREKKYQTPNITLRVHRNTPEVLWDAITDTLASGIGMPALYNDDVVCPALEKIGIPDYDSHDYCMNGCNQIDIFGKSHMGLEDGEVNFAKCLEYALHNGVNDMNGNQDSIPTGDLRNAETYEEVERAFLEQMEYLTYLACNSANNAQHARANYGPNPLRSCFIDGCLEKGIDYRNGGPLYGHGQILSEGMPDTGDSLWAIKKLVFIEKKYTMAQLIDALCANFEGYDELHHDFKNCEKFGNDIPEVDDITARINNRFFQILKRNHTYRGGIYTGGCSTFSRAAGYGANTAALPNGKKKGESLLADSIAATPGCDTHGPTSLIKSVLKYDHVEAGSGFVFQNKFDKKIFNTEKGRESFKALAKAFFAGGGQQYTVTVVSREELLDAMENPDAHRDLIVRVGGYSAYFVQLDRGLQENVIARTFLEV
ncbi:MAG: hypothetical protein IJO81_01980 [Clostridia bacterium]|nr:hypothetical protein [Clostridia bacterium]